MKVREVQRLIESWAPREIAWEGDNTGFQCGDPESEVRGILVALDPSEVVVDEALSRRANLIVTHHPLLFRPLHSLATDTARGRIVRALVQHGIALYSVHTNLDFTYGGTSFALAHTLGLTNVSMLHRPFKILKKIVTYVPSSSVDRVAGAMADAGAGILGNYDQCSFRVEGIGTFRGNADSSPRLRARGTLERVQEIRLEMVAPAWSVERIVEALRQAHPYEEVAYEVFGCENLSADFGMGVIGDLASPVTLKGFLGSLKRALRCAHLRYAGNLRHVLRRVALCGGSGSELIEEAALKGADAFVTADIRYHSFQDVPHGMAVVDAGHFETEHPVVSALVARLRQEFHRTGKRIAIHASRRSVNPVQYF